jgi:hypothetical protein
MQQNRLNNPARCAFPREASILFLAEHCMTGRHPGWNRLLLLVVAALFFVPAAKAQTVGLDRQGTVMPNTIVPRPSLPALTPAQKSAIYNAVQAQRVRSAARVIIHPAIGAPVPPSLTLSDLPAEALSVALPDQPGSDDAAFLKYAMVGDDVVVVDPIAMRVVDVIHRGAMSGVLSGAVP